jgi:ribosomal protein L7/L12
MANHGYAEAINTLYNMDNADFNSRQLLFEIAKRDPGALTYAYEQLANKKEDEEFKSPEGETPAQFIQRIRDLLSSGPKISAIKAWREVTGDGLKYSKQVIEDLEARLNGWDETNPWLTAQRNNW